MKKLLILTLAIFCFYGCKSTNSKSETSGLDDPTTEALMDIALSQGLTSIVMNIYCNSSAPMSLGITKKIETLYSLIDNYDSTTLRKDLSTNDYVYSGAICTYDEKLGVCSKLGRKADPTDRYQYNVLDQHVEDATFVINVKQAFVQESSIDKISSQELNNKLNTILTIYPFRNSIEFITSLGTVSYNIEKACNIFEKSLKTRPTASLFKNASEVTNIKVESKSEKGTPIEVKGKKFDTSLTKISYTAGIEDNYNHTMLKNYNPDLPVVTETSWIASSGELKGLGLKHSRTFTSCYTGSDNDKGECKEVTNYYFNSQMVDYKITPIK